jgi:hypothetical protein
MFTHSREGVRKDKINIHPQTIGGGDIKRLLDVIFH